MYTALSPTPETAVACVVLLLVGSTSMPMIRFPLLVNAPWTIKETDRPPVCHAHPRIHMSALSSGASAVPAGAPGKSIWTSDNASMPQTSATGVVGVTAGPPLLPQAGAANTTRPSHQPHRLG